MIGIGSLRDSLRQHVRKLEDLEDLGEPRPGELARTSLEEEFMD